MHTAVKLAVSLAVLLVATGVGRRHPSLAGLIATMPLTGLLVMLWLHLESGGEREVMTGYAKGAAWGVVPSILFFLVAWVAFRRHLPLSLVLAASFGVWLAGAFVHQWLLKG